MKRREFIAALGGAAAWPIAARGQQQRKLPTIGFLGGETPSVMSLWVTAFVRRLHELGWSEGRTVAIEYRWAEGHSERFAEIATEFVRIKVDVIVTAGTAPVIAAKRETSVIPIVFAAAGDPVGTGLSNQSADLPGKRVELLREVVPGLRRLAIMANFGSPIGVLETGQVQAAAHTYGLEDNALQIRRAEDIAHAVEALKGRADALYVVTDPLVHTRTYLKIARHRRRAINIG